MMNFCQVLVRKNCFALKEKKEKVEKVSRVQICVALSPVAAMAGEGAKPLVKLLKEAFSQASLSVTLAGLTESERNRRIAFYGKLHSASDTVRIDF